MAPRKVNPLRLRSRCLRRGHRPVHGCSIWPKIFAKRIGIDYPIILAPMAGGPSTPALVASVCEAGGLGSLGVGYLPPDAIRAAIREIRARTDRPFAANLFIPERSAEPPTEATLQP